MGYNIVKIKIKKPRKIECWLSLTLAESTKDGWSVMFNSCPLPLFEDILRFPRLIWLRLPLLGFGKYGPTGTTKTAKVVSWIKIITKRPFKNWVEKWKPGTLLQETTSIYVIIINWNKQFITNNSRGFWVIRIDKWDWWIVVAIVSIHSSG